MKKKLNTIVCMLLSSILFISMANLSMLPMKVYAQPSQTTQTNELTDNSNTYYIVSPDGLGHFSSIQEAVDYAQDGDTLVIYPGIYTEAVKVTDKNINITGIDKNVCILQYDTSSYHCAPLEIAAGNISNMTIHGIDPKPLSNNTEDDEFHAENLSAEATLFSNNFTSTNETLSGNMISSTSESISDNSPLLTDEFLLMNEKEQLHYQMLQEIRMHQNNHTAYAVHIDQNYLYEKNISITDCIIISENNHCVGIGSRGKSNITFENCEFIASGSGGCLYLHDCALPEFSGDVNFSLKNCNLTSYRNPYIISIDNLGSFNKTYLTFENVKTKVVAYDNMECYVPNNISTGIDVDTLSLLDKANLLEISGFTSTALHNLVHELSYEDSVSLHRDITNNYNDKTFITDTSLLKEGITYIRYLKKSENNPVEISTNSSETTNIGKRSVLNLYNSDEKIGNGWCGLNNVYLTPESHGNTLIEMNSLITTGLSQ